MIFFCVELYHYMLSLLSEIGIKRKNMVHFNALYYRRRASLKQKLEEMYLLYLYVRLSNNCTH